MRLAVFLSGLVVVICLLAHLSTFTSYDAAEWFLPPATLVAASALMLVLAALVNPQLTAKHSPGTKKQTLRQVLDGAPTWAISMLIVIFIYGGINSIVFIATDPPGEPRRAADGTFELFSHGKVLRQIDEAEFHRERRSQLRGLSGHSLALSTVAFVGIFAAYRRSRTPGTTAGLHPVGWRGNFQKSRAHRSGTNGSLR